LPTGLVRTLPCITPNLPNQDVCDECRPGQEKRRRDAHCEQKVRRVFCNPAILGLKTRRPVALRRRLSPGLPNIKAQYVTIFVCKQQNPSPNFGIMKGREYSGKSPYGFAGAGLNSPNYVWSLESEVQLTLVSSRHRIAPSQ
jgi:hypothetical protein